MRPQELIDERILIIGINEADIKSVSYPIPDEEIANLLQTLQASKPRVIGLDIFRNLPVTPGHKKLVAAFKNSKNLIAIEKALPEEIPPPPTLPLEQVGFADAIVDDDSHLRRSLLATPTSKDYKFSLSLRLAEAYLSQEGIKLENGIKDPEAMRFGDTELPRFFPNSGGYIGADAGGVQVLLNFRSGLNRYRILSLNDIKTGKFNPKWLRDRIVIIGMTAPSIKDSVNTSAITGIKLRPGLAYGVEIQAHACSQIISAVLQNRPLLKVWSDGWEYLWILGWGILGIILGRVTQSPFKNLLSVGITTTGLIGVSYLLIILGWWIPVVPTLLVLVINGVGLTAFYQYDRNLRGQIQERQIIIERTFDTIHNGPLQTLAKLLRDTREQELPQNQVVSELEHLNQELRAVYESIKRENLTQTASLYLGKGLELDLQTPIHEMLYEVYSQTLERDLPYFKTLKVKVRTFDPIDPRHLTLDQKRGLCRFLEEALCNVGKYAIGATRLSVTCTQKDDWYTLSITDNGQVDGFQSEGRGTQQSQNLAKQLKGKFRRELLSKKGTVCELTWPVPKFDRKVKLTKGR
jgi:CHASE2 domain-containing sensor protein